MGGLEGGEQRGEDGDCRTRREKRTELKQREDFIRETVGKRTRIEKTSGEDIKKEKDGR